MRSAASGLTANKEFITRATSQADLERPVEVVAGHLQALVAGISLSNQPVGLYPFNFFQQGGDIFSIGRIISGLR